MTMPPPERLPSLPTPTPTPTPPLMGQMTPATQTVAPAAEPVMTPAAPGPSPLQRMANVVGGALGEAMGGQEGLFSQWEFLGAKWQMTPEGARDEYFAAGSSDRKRWDEEYTSYVAGGVAEGVGAAPPLFSPNEERMLTDLQNSIEIGKMDEGQAWDIIVNYWSKEETQTRRAEDATRRGETLLAGAHPGPNLPMTGPGGMGAGLQQKYGLPNLTPGVQGLPGSQALGIFGQAQEQLGLPPQLPPLEPPQFQLPNWQAVGRAMPNFGGTNYFDQLLKEGRMTAPGL